MRNQKPHAAFIDAFASFAEVVYGRGETVMLRNAVDKCGTKIEGSDLLLAMIPTLTGILPTEDAKIDGIQSTHGIRQDFGAYHPRESDSRFKYAMYLLLRAISSMDLPLIVIMENLHWADEASLDLLYSFITDKSNVNTLFVATVRDDLDDHTAFRFLKKINKIMVAVTELQLKNLNEESTAFLVADALQMDFAMARPIAGFVFTKTLGNRCCIELFLNSLVEGGYLVYNDGANPFWRCDVDEIRIEFGCTIYEAIKVKLYTLPDKVRCTLQYASCIGSKLDLEMLGYLMNEPPSVISSFLNLAVKQRLLRYRTFLHPAWLFSHDTIQEITASLVPSDELAQYHYRIGRRLWRCFDLEKLDENIFVVVGQLLRGLKCIVDDRERVAIAKLCLRAGERSVYMTNFQTACYYLTHAIQILGKQSFWKEHYSFCLELYNAAIEFAYCVGQYDDATFYVGVLLKNAVCFDDTLRGHTTQIFV